MSKCKEPEMGHDKMAELLTQYYLKMHGGDAKIFWTSNSYWIIRHLANGTETKGIGSTVCYARKWIHKQRKDKA